MTVTKRKLRVLHILNSKIYSGAENVVITIIRNLGNSIEFAYESPDGSIREVLKKNSIKFFPVKATTPSEVRRVMDIFIRILFMHMISQLALLLLSLALKSRLSIIFTIMLPGSVAITLSLFLMLLLLSALQRFLPYLKLS